MDKRKLQSLINRCAKASTAFYHAQAALNEHAISVYGVEPGEIDCDQIIDAVMGGCGVSPGMSATEFDVAMHESLERAR